MQVCKFVSFRLLEYPCEKSSSLKRTERVRSAFYKYHVWKPRIPLHLTAQNALNPPQPDLSPKLSWSLSKQAVFNIDFGDTNGRSLSFLTQISAILEGEDRGIIGLEFSYNIGPLSLYGRKDGVQKAFSIDGPGGERIVRVDAEYDNPDFVIGLNRLKVSLVIPCSSEFRSFSRSCRRHLCCLFDSSWLEY